MSELQALEAQLQEAREKFLQAVEDLRPALHKYCARMTGSVLDGEDVVQETLAQAYYKLSMMKQDVPLRSWLFKIAHNKCIDFLRSRRAQFMTWEEEWENIPDTTPEASETLEQQEMATEAWSSLIALLPPRERACVILKDLLDHSLNEIAETLDSPLTAVKAALHRGRQKLRAQADSQATPPAQERSELLERYVALFNERDWAGVKQLLTVDTQCDVVGIFSGRGRDTIAGNYLQTYDGLWPWKMTRAWVDGEEIMACWHEVAGRWQLRGIARIEWADSAVKYIRDYTHVSYLLRELDLADQEPSGNARSD